MSSPIWTALAASVRGDLHEKIGQKNQDSVRLRKPSGVADALLLAVSDGHGSTRSFRSDRGSVLATECALRELRRFIRRHGPDAPLSSIRRQAKAIWPRTLLAAWRKAVRDDLVANPFTPLEFAAFPEKAPAIKPGEDLPPIAYLAYGATLVAVAITRRYILYAQLGDGDILSINSDGEVSRPLRRDHKFYANVTSSLCTQHAFSEFQVRVDPMRTAAAPALVMLSTDGYANCFGEDESFFQVGADFFSYLRKHGPELVAENLAAWLRESSRDGSGDDITVGLAARLNALQSKDPYRISETASLS